MSKALEAHYEKTAVFAEKHNDPELNDFLLGLGRQLEDADMLKHQLGYLLMHVKCTVAAPVRTVHLQDALTRAARFLEKLDTAA